MNRQQIFDTVTTELFKQGSIAVYFDVGCEQPLCMYRTPDGKKCAIGCLIPDGHPATETDYTVAALLSSFPELLSMWGVENMGDRLFLASLQGFHDRTLNDAELSDWPSCFQNFARDHSLIYNAPS